MNGGVLHENSRSTVRRSSRTTHHGAMQWVGMGTFHLWIDTILYSIPGNRYETCYGTIFDTFDTWCELVGLIITGFTSTKSNQEGFNQCQGFPYWFHFIWPQMIISEFCLRWILSYKLEDGCTFQLLSTNIVSKPCWIYLWKKEEKKAIRLSAEVWHFYVIFHSVSPLPS